VQSFEIREFPRLKSNLDRQISGRRMVGTYNYLDLVPKGRDEGGLAFTMSWVRHHDRYSDGYLADKAKPYWPANAATAS
jgi:predicted dithiol-disulfide oxidoreductase (DUF899 family)